LNPSVEKVAKLTCLMFNHLVLREKLIQAASFIAMESYAERSRTIRSNHFYIKFKIAKCHDAHNPVCDI
jgi:hypothetical protein